MAFIVSFRLLLASVFFILAFTPIHAENLAVTEGNDIIVQYNEPLKNAAKEVIELYPRIKQELKGILGWEIDFKPSIVLIRENARFQEIIANPYIIAFAIPHKDLIVIDYSKMNVSPFTLGVTMKHEMCHVLLGRNIPSERLPRWLNEGFCQWVTGGVGELMIDDRQPNLNKASLSHRLIPLSLLSRNFPVDRDQLILAYEESKNVVEYMVTEYGQRGVVSVMSYLKEGDDVDEATRKGLSISLDELEKHWIQSLQDKVTWIGYVAANIYTILLFAAALLTICGFLRIIIKRRLRASRVGDDDEVVTD
jgi:hypothetical protein